MKASNIYQTLKSRAKASSTAKPQLPGIGSPLNLKAKNPIDPPKKTKDNKYHLDKSPRNPYHFQKPTEKMVKTIKPLAQKTPPRKKLPMAKASPTKRKVDPPKKTTKTERVTTSGKVGTTTERPNPKDVGGYNGDKRNFPLPPDRQPDRKRRPNTVKPERTPKPTRKDEYNKPRPKAAPAKLKKDTPKTKTPNEKKYEKYGYKKKIVKAESSSYDATKGELTKTFSDADVKKYGIKKTSTTKAKIKSPVKMDSCASEMPSEATGGSNPKRAMRKAKRRGNRGGREAMKKFRKCKRSRYGRGKAN